ncbi:phage holin family protein [Blastococcus sp. TF02A_35]|uniref:phage holin family protein n=1 Tax=Blastococcus sp. TF02A-35 TaxID=2559612 RepID=UPI00107301AD|nr:phage holin family protein [Blastococcus sp. TF02A_35]TFV47210.1 phage holin family protein [Blastococcus sp. TF02A_35]
MLRFALKVVLMAGVFYLVDLVLDGVAVVGNPDAPLGEVGTFLWIALIFAVVNAVVGPILRLMSLPFVLVTLGLFLLVINAALLGITAAITDRLTVDGFVTAVLGGLLLAIGGWAADQIVEKG